VIRWEREPMHGVYNTSDGDLLLGMPQRTKHLDVIFLQGNWLLERLPLIYVCYMG
jgi:hypothetical protein